MHSASEARFIVIQNVDDVDVMSSLSIRSSASREHVALQFSMLLGRCGCVFSGVIAESLLFLQVTVNNGKQWQPRWSSSCIFSWSLSILKNKCLNCKCWSTGDREDVRGRGWERVNLQHWCEFTTWMNKCTLDNFECQRAITCMYCMSHTAIKTGKGNCRKLHSEWTNHSPYGPRLRNV